MSGDRFWLLIARKMSGEASLQELNELESLLKSHPELHFSLQALTELWKTETNHSPEELRHSFEKHIKRMKDAGISFGTRDSEHQDIPDFIVSPPARPFRKILVGIVSMAAIVIAIWFGAKPDTSTLPQPVVQVAKSEITTRNGSRTKVVLPDGTKVWLNAGSTLTYDREFGDTNRAVKLVGEGYFDVVRNESKPFLIHTEAMDIRVLGTIFNVKSYPEEDMTEATLIKGSIEVQLKDCATDRIILKPNEKLVVSNEKTVLPTVPERAGTNNTTAEAQREFSIRHLNYFSRDSTILETSWVENRLVFEDESFAELAAKFERWYGVEFRFKDQDVQRFRFTGSFDTETLSEALDAMRITAPFDYRIIGTTVEISKP
jgi:transmembrane sensor